VYVIQKSVCEELEKKTFSNWSVPHNKEKKPHTARAPTYKSTHLQCPTTQRACGVRTCS
jgi:hypothetical protein